VRLTKILLAYSETQVVSVLEEELSNAGYFVIVAENYQEAYGKYQCYEPNLCLVDAKLPSLGGLELVKKIRQESDVPMIILSNCEDTVDKMVAFRLGVDDYVCVPFVAAEVLYRIKAILHRIYQKDPVRGTLESELVFDDLSINNERHQVFCSGREVQLTAREFDLLWLLASRPGYVFTREQLLYYLWDSDYLGDLKNVTILVCRLRSKLEPDPEHPTYIHTVRGVGYKFSSAARSRNNSARNMATDMAAAERR